MEGQAFNPFFGSAKRTTIVRQVHDAERKRLELETVKMLKCCLKEKEARGEGLVQG